MFSLYELKVKVKFRISFILIRKSILLNKIIDKHYILCTKIVKLKCVWSPIISSCRSTLNMSQSVSCIVAYFMWIWANLLKREEKFWPSRHWYMWGSYLSWDYTSNLTGYCPMRCAVRKPPCEPPHTHTLSTSYPSFSITSSIAACKQT